MNTNKKFYISYGSNMNLEQMAVRCPTAKVVGTTMLNGWRLQFNGVATIIPEPGAQTPVVVWTIEPADERALDRYEGFPNFYYKKDLTVILDGKPVTAMVYIMSDGYSENVPSEYYFNIIAQGYKSAGFSPKPLMQALERARIKQWEHNKKPRKY